MHWGFESWDEAVLFSEKFKRFFDNPNFDITKPVNEYCIGDIGQLCQKVYAFINVRVCPYF